MVPRLRSTSTSSWNISEGVASQSRRSSTTLGTAHVAGSGAAELGVEVGAERGDELPQLVVGLAPVGGEHRAGDAERLDGAVVAEPLGGELLRAEADQHGAEGVDEALDLDPQRIATQAAAPATSNSIVGPPFGSFRSRVTRNPKRS